MTRGMHEKCRAFRGRPIELTTESGKKFRGIVMDFDSAGINILDHKGRKIQVAFKHIVAIVEPRMRLQPFCEDDDRCRKDDERRNHHEHEDCDDCDFDE